MDKRTLFLKDRPVLECAGFDVRILDYDHLPYALRYRDVNFDDIFHGWTESRILNLSRSNAKKIMAGFRLTQNNSYQIASLMHFASLDDCYWLKSEDDTASWDEVSLFRAELSKDVADTAVFGKNCLFKGKIHSPEPSVQGMSAKAWYRAPDDSLWLYKVGIKELAASDILDALHADHVQYTDASKEAVSMADAQHLQKIADAGEKLVKCPIITNEERSIVTWDDYQVYCDRNEINPYIAVTSLKDFHEMRVADYILGNADRHGSNWGFYMDNSTGRLIGLHPLFDHDHAFSNETDIPSQTSPKDETLRSAAMRSLQYPLRLRMQPLLNMKKPVDLSTERWNAVIERVKDCERVLSQHYTY